ncbi:MAG: hypothetical protein ACI4TU_08360 [Candidatus Cryptobacteroides sp.]
MKKQIILSILLLALGGVISFAQVNDPEPPINTYYYGPNAFPVPEMGFGKTSSKMKFEIGASMAGHQKLSLKDDITGNIYFNIKLPLFTERVNFCIWGEALDAYRSSEAANSYRGVSGPSHGAKVGEIYLSTDIMILRQEKHHVSMTLRCALKTANGDDNEYRRYYNSPGYFFDATLGREFIFRDDLSLNLAACTGFLCWQCKMFSQNDAVMYGIAAAFRANWFTLSAHFGGYTGWRSNGDSPISIRTEAAFNIKPFDIRLKYQEGLNDWPYRQVSLGVAYSFPVLK